MEKKSAVLRAEARGVEESFRHPFDSDCEVRGVQLAAQTGLKRVGVNLFRVSPGKASFPYHAHHVEEEWLYVLSGRGQVEVDGETHDIGPHDFVGFPPATAHRLFNPGPDELVYLSGGERNDVEIADFPRHGKRMARKGARVTIHPLNGEPFPGYEKL